MSYNVDFKPSHRQHEAFTLLREDNGVDFVGYGGAAFGGKSYLGCNWVTFGALEFPGTRWFIGRRELKNLKKTTLETLWKVFRESNIRAGIDYTHNQQKDIIYFHNDSEYTSGEKKGEKIAGSQIILVDTAYKPLDKDYLRFGGLEVTGGFIDESNETPIGAIDILQTRIGRCLNDYYNVPAKILETFNPDKSHVRRRYWKPYKEKKEPKNRKFVRALPKDNPSPEVGPYVKRIMNSGNKNLIERMIRGNFDFDDDPMTLVSNDAATDYFKNIHVKAEGKKYLTIDVARKGRDLTVFRVWHGWRVVARYEIKKSGIDTVVEKAEWIQKKYGIPSSRTIADEGGVGGGVVDFLKCKGFVSNASPIVKKSKKNQANYENLKTQCQHLFANRLEERTVAEDCNDESIIDKTVEEMTVVKELEQTSDKKIKLTPKAEIKGSLGRSPDEWDSIYMREWFDLKNTDFTVF